MHLIMLGLSHRTAPVEVRERLAMAGEALEEAIGRLKEQYPHVEWAIVSTCNRTEWYLARPAHHAPDVPSVIRHIAEQAGLDLATCHDALRQRRQREAMAHLFRVASGIDSMVLGEPQILGQVKRAYEHACRCGSAGPVLHRVFQQAIACARQVRQRTGVGQGRGSIGSVAVDFARQVFETFDDKCIAAIGAGAMAKTALTHLGALGPRKLWVVNRSMPRAQAMLEALSLPSAAGAAVRPFEQLDDILTEADIILTSTAAPRPIITKERFRPILKRRRFRPLFIIDIALPRDVEPAVGELANVYLYNLDDLQRTVEQTHQQRAEQAGAAGPIVEEAVQSCMAQIQHRDIGRLIRELRQRLHGLGAAEQQRTLRRLVTAGAAADPAEAEALLADHTRRLINKILHLPLSKLDQSNAHAPLAYYATALEILFDLEGEPSSHTAAVAHTPREPAEPSSDTSSNR